MKVKKLYHGTKDRKKDTPPLILRFTTNKAIQNKREEEEEQTKKKTKKSRLFSTFYKTPLGKTNDPFYDGTTF